MTIKPYPEYKESGVEWLGAVPKSWPIGRIKDSVVLAKNGVWGDEPTGGNDDVWCVRVADFDRPSLSVSDSERTIRSVPASDRLGRELQRGNLLLEKSGGGEKSPVGFVALFDHSDNAVCSNFVARVELGKDMVPKYWAYLHATTYAVRLTQRSIKQTSGIQNLDQSSYFNELTVYPPHAEQRQIADYLDAQTAKIDALIGKQERLIETLAERRQAVISHAVTKGLDPNAPTKDSGVEWLGSIPESWMASRLKHVAAVQTGLTLGKVVPLAEAIELPYLRVANVQTTGVNLDEVKAVLVGRAEWTKYRLRDGDVLMTEGGDIDKLGRGCIWSNQVDPCVHQNHVFAVRCGRNIYSRLLVYLLDAQVARNYFRLTAKKTTNLASTNSTTLGNLPLALPELPEQVRIVEHLDRETSRIDTLSAKAREMIDVLKERRQALISAAVTGKIDVRGLA